MECYQVTVKQTLHNFKTILINPEMRRAGKRRMEVKSDVCLFELLFDEERNHDELIIMNPYRLGFLLLHLVLIQHILHFNNFVRELLIHLNKIFPVNEMVFIQIISKDMKDIA